MHMTLVALWLHSLLTQRSVLAVMTNHTIDDAGPLVQYIPSTDGLCVGCAPTNQYDASELNNGTVTTYSVTDNVVRAIELNFTGSAIYVFLAAASAPSPLNQQCGFSLDGASVGDPRIFFTKTPPTTARYNILAYANQSIPDGMHTFQILLSQKTAVNFDYAVYTSNDPSSSAISSAPSGLSTSQTPSPTIDKKKPPVTAIAGGAAGGIALLLALLSIFFLSRCSRRRHLSRRRHGSELSSIEEVPLPPLGGTVSAKDIGEPQDRAEAPSIPGSAEEDAAVLAAEVRALRAQVQRMGAERADGGTAGSDTSSVSRSLSTMKREQTRAVRDYQRGYIEADTLVHTDSGLRLTAGHVVDELPPTYAAE